MRLKYQRFLQIAPFKDVDFIWLTQNAEASFYVMFIWAADYYFKTDMKDCEAVCGEDKVEVCSV